MEFNPLLHLTNLEAGEWAEMGWDGYDGVYFKPGLAIVGAAGAISANAFKMTYPALMPAHHTAGDMVYFVIYGAGRLRTGGVDHDMLPGDLFLIPAGTNHSIKTTVEAGHLVFGCFSLHGREEDAVRVQIDGSEARDEGIINGIPADAIKGKRKR